MIKKLSEKDYILLQQVFQLEQVDLFKSLYKYMQQLYSKDDVVFTSDYIYVKGELPVCLVAHTDTVFKSPPDILLYDRDKNIIAAVGEGCGADDRLGVFLILKLLKAGYRPSIIFTDKEESGCLGASELIKNVKVPFADFKYMIELDRANGNDCVFYQCDNPKFTKYVEDFGFTFAIGSFSDIYDISRAWKTAAVNLSVGYYCEHTSSEHIKVEETLATYEKVCKMLNASTDLKEKFEFIPRGCGFSPQNYYPGYYYDDNEYYDWYETYGDKYGAKCHKCGRDLDPYEYIETLGKDGYTVYYCCDCLQGNVEWCSMCNEPFEIETPDEAVCCYCRNKMDINNWDKSLKKGKK